jgi:hypothetical protein
MQRHLTPSLGGSAKHFWKKGPVLKGGPSEGVQGSAGGEGESVPPERTRSRGGREPGHMLELEVGG